MNREELQDRLDTLCERCVADGVPGVAAIVASPNDILYEGAAGQRHAAGGPMTPDTVLDIASMTKPIAALAAMQLVERGLLELDAPAGRYLPEIDALKVLDGWRGDTPILRPPLRALTLRHLLTHTAGLGYEVWSADTARYNALYAIPDVHSGDPRAMDMVMMNDPGAAWLYGTAIDWVSQIVARVSGEGFGDYLSAQILEPLGMVDTGFALSDRMLKRRAKIHVRGVDGVFQETERMRLQDPPVETGGAGLYSTARDYIRFAQLFLCGGRWNEAQIIRPETMRLMGRNAMDACRVVSLRSNRPAFARDLTVFPEVDQTWGLSFHINEATTNAGRKGGSLSWAGIFNTFFWIDPTSKICAVFMTQTTPFLDPQVAAAFDDFERTVYAALDKTGS